MGRVLRALTLLLLAPMVASATNQYQQAGSASIWYADANSALDALNTAYATGGCTISVGQVIDTGGGSAFEQIKYVNYDRTCAGVKSVNAGGYIAYHSCAANTNSYAWSDATHNCTQQQLSCPAAGTKYAPDVLMRNVLSTNDVPVPAPSGPGVCFVNGHGICPEFVGGSDLGTYCTQWEYTGQGDAYATAGTTAAWTGSLRTSRGVMVSISSSVDRCIQFNNEFVCPASAPATGTCTTSPGGNAYCTRDSTSQPASPPAPDTGTPGQAATPDVSVSAGAGSSTTVDAYSPGVLLGSSNSQPATGTPAPAPSGGTTSGSTGGSACGTTANPCHTQLDGSPTLPPLQGAPEFADSYAEFIDSISNAPLGQLALGLAGSVPEGGSPPAVTFNLASFNNAPVTLEAPPEVVEKVSTVFPTMARLSWILTAIFIFLAA